MEGVTVAKQDLSKSFPTPKVVQKYLFCLSLTYLFTQSYRSKLHSLIKDRKMMQNTI